MPLPPLTLCASSDVDERGNVTFRFKDAAGGTHDVTLAVEALKTLAPMMLLVLQSSETNDRVGQPSVLTSARAGYLEDGTPLLGLGLNGMELAVCLREPRVLEQLALCIAEFHATEAGSKAIH